MVGYKIEDCFETLLEVGDVVEVWGWRVVGGQVAVESGLVHFVHGLNERECFAFAWHG